MLDGLIQQFAGGGAQSMEGEALHGNVSNMLSAAPESTVTSAVGDALSAMGGGGFAQSVEHAATNAGPEQRNSLTDTLLSAVSRGGGSPSSALEQFGGGGGGSLGPAQLAGLAEHVFNNHGDALAGTLGSQLNDGGGGSSGVLGVLGNPMVRQIGMQLAKKML